MQKSKYQVAKELLDSLAEKNFSDQASKEAIIFMDRLLEKEQNAPRGTNRERMTELVEKMLSGSITARAEEISTNFYHLKLFDSVEREIIANIAFEKMFGSYHLKHFELLP